MWTTIKSADQPIRLPTAKLLLVPALSCLVVGGGWAGIAALLQFGKEDIIGAILAGLVPALAVVVAMVLIRPWHARPVTTWPFVFLAGTVIGLLATLAGGLVLYFASSYGTVGTWLCLVVCYWAGLFGLVWVYGSCMKRRASVGSLPSTSREPPRAEPME